MFRKFLKSIEQDYGSIIVLHTFGKDLKFHPHTHIITNVKCSFEQKFSISWKKILLKNLSTKPSRYPYGYHVWSDEKNLNPIQIGDYVARYVRHPPMSNSRIVSYNNNSVSIIINYQNSKEIRTFSSLEFIHRLIQHIPPKQFRLIRYYGKYARNSK